MEGSSYISASVNLAKLCIGTGILALPFATVKGGIIASPLGIALIALWNGVSCNQMIECKNACEFKHAPDMLSSTYSRIAYCSGGWSAVYLTDFSIIVTLLGVCVTYQITFGKLMEDFFESCGYTTISNSELSLVAFLILAVPVLITDDVSHLTKYSVVGMIMLLVGVSAIIIFGIINFGNDVLTGVPAWQELPLWPASLDDISTFLGITTFGFGICALVFPVEQSMTEKSHFGWAVFLSLLAVWIIYSVMGIGVGILFTHAPGGISSNILENLPQQSIAAEVVRVSFALICLLTYPLAFIPPVKMIEHYLMVIVRRLTDNTPSGESQFLSQIKYFAYESLTAASSDASERGVDIQGGSVESAEAARSDDPRPSTALRYTFRLLLLTLCTYISCKFPCFGLLISLLGCFTVTILSFVLPPFFRLKLVSLPHYEGTGNGGYRILLDIIMTGLGSLLCITATMVVTLQILNRSEGDSVC